MSVPTVIDRVAVRMYRKLLGDCFVLIVEGHDPETNAPLSSRIMIDCGVLQGTPGAGDLMEAVVTDVYDQTGGGPLDLIVVTHEHHDHISGFSLAREVFEAQAKVTDRLWFAWTEDPQDADAQHYQQAYGHAFAALSGLAGQLKVPTKAAEDTDAEELLGLAGFSGPLGLDGGAKPLRGSRAIYARLRDWAGLDGTEYLSPGEVRTTPGAIGLRTYVLGPPRDRALLTNALGKKGETYFALAGSGSIETAQKDSPFSPRYRWRSDDSISNLPADAGERETWLYERYFADYSPCQGEQHKFKDAKRACAGDFSLHEPQTYRKLDNAARSTFSNLALRMDNNTNNTSLVLAFELPDDSGVMLFAADAQVGNWLSWDQVQFRETPEADPLKLTSTDLLRRTRLYKVGHHGSHNATLKDKGLELMSDDLIALIPTDAEFALKQSSAWQMPNPDVDEALQHKTRARVLRGDKPAEETIKRHGEVDPGNADKFAAMITDHELWVEVCIYERASCGGQK